jgi:hypothetical protein
VLKKKLLDEIKETLNNEVKQALLFSGAAKNHQSCCI